MEEKLKSFQKIQDECKCIGYFYPVAQQVFEDEAKGVITLITTIMCLNCSHLYFDTQMTNIAIKVNIEKVAEAAKKAMEEEENNGKN